ncbi:Stp1/IreP family PP2C-type Ser/Thr phosphatase, partial [Iamia sp.]|uniref:Stp1/IreP family PP2C-type Ser/Thr phosphatase n=1 Tax=Iamia sp. TaxID=2722710 RepID=UPI002D039417
MTSFRVGSASDVGQLRTNNQDSKLIADAVSVFAVADGMGGHQGGEVASAIAVETLEAVISEPTTASVVEAVKEANRRIFSRAEDTTELRGMGTTLVAIALVNQDGADEEIAWVNVGDSRVYLLRDGELHQLSRDHSLVEDLRRGGQLSEEEAAIHPQRNILTRALGIDQEVEVDSDSLLPLTGDRFLLCSDGLFNEVDPTTLVDTLTSGEDPDAVAHELVRLANAGGGRDNITCVVVDVTDDGGGATRAAATGASTAGGATAVAGATDATVVDQSLVDAAEPAP